MICLSKAISFKIHGQYLNTVFQKYGENKNGRELRKIFSYTTQKKDKHRKNEVRYARKRIIRYRAIMSRALLDSIQHDIVQTTFSDWLARTSRKANVTSRSDRFLFFKKN